MRRIGKTDGGGVLLEMTGLDLIRLMDACKAMSLLFDEVEVCIPTNHEAVATEAPPAATIVQPKPVSVQSKRPPVKSGQRNCIQCHEAFTPKRKDQTCCGKACRKAYGDTHRKPKAAKEPAKSDAHDKKTCADCGNPFVPWRRDQRFCSACAKRGHAAKKPVAPAVPTKAAAATQAVSYQKNLAAKPVDRLAAIRAADAKARMKAAGIAAPVSVFGSDSGIGAPTDDDIAAVRAGRDDDA